MPDQSQLVQSIYSAIFNGVGSSGASAAGESSICLEWPGMPVSADEYDNAWTASNPSGSQSATQAFSALVDPIPNDSSAYFPSGLGVESVYGLILGATVSGGPACSAFANAQAKYANLVIGSSLENMAVYHPAFAQPASWCSPANTGWATISVDLNAPSPAPPAHVQTAISQVLATQAGATGWRSAAINSAAVRNVTLPIRQYSAPAEAPIGTGHLAAARPMVAAMVQPQSSLGAAVAKPATAAAQMHLTPATMAASEAALNRTVQVRSVTQVLAHPVVAHPTVSPAVLNRLQNLPAGVVMPHAPVVPPPLAIQPVQSKPITSSSLHLNLQCMRVTILREWLDPLLLRLGGWSLDGMSAGSVSSGTPDNNPGFFPLLPLSFLVIRNVSVSGTWSADDKTVAMQAASSNNAVAFGPLTLSNAAAGQSTFDGSTLTIKGMQIVAWMCMPTPKLPPN